MEAQLVHRAPREVVEVFQERLQVALVCIQFLLLLAVLLLRHRHSRGVRVIKLVTTAILEHGGMPPDRVSPGLVC